MRRLYKILLLPLLVVNVLAALLLVCCAYSPLIPPGQFPLLSLAGLAFPWVLAANVAFLVAWLILYRRYMLPGVSYGRRLSAKRRDTGNGG